MYYTWMTSKCTQEQEQMVNTVVEVGRAVGMAVGSNKCATATMHKGRPVADNASRKRGSQQSRKRG